MCVSPQRRAIFDQNNVKKWSEPEVFCTFSLANALLATAACNFSTSELEKVVRDRQFFNIFTCECAFRHSGVQFFDISTSKSAPDMRCFVHVHLRMCVSPQRRAIFRHLNLKKCSGHEVFCTFWLQNVRFATAACNFVFLCWAGTSAPAALTSLLFDWPDTRIIEKTQHFATSLTFGADVSFFFWLSDYCIFCRLTWLLYCCAFHLLFNSAYCRKFLFKLPSIKSHILWCKKSNPGARKWRSDRSLTSHSRSSTEGYGWLLCGSCYPQWHSCLHVVDCCRESR